MAQAWADERGEAPGDARQHLECAPTFAEFIYRFWLENVIWFKLEDSRRR